MVPGGADGFHVTAFWPGGVDGAIPTIAPDTTPGQIFVSDNRWGLPMKAVVTIILIVGIMIFLGWITFQKSGERSTVTIETQQIEKDTKQVLQKGRQLSEDAGKKARKAIDETSKDSNSSKSE